MTACFRALSLSFALAAIGSAASAQAPGADWLHIHNASAHPVEVLVRTFQFRVRMGQAGPWRQPGSDSWYASFGVHSLDPTARMSGRFETLQSPDVARQYRIDYTCMGGARQGSTFTARHPVARAEWDTSREVTLILGADCN